MIFCNFAVMKTGFLPILLLVCLLSAMPAAAEIPSGEVIRTTLLRELGSCPRSQLADVYKNFFQDRFGPGHILADTAASAAYLRRELAETADFEGPLYEPTGADGQFVRVNLSVIGDGLVPYDTYFDAFVRSVREIGQPEPDEWREYWSAVDAQLCGMGYRFPDEEADRAMIDRKLRDGDFVVHHSDRYNAAYRFHYRIFSRSLFLSEILPLLGEN